MNEDGHVSISRRGLLAAGLTAAVVGSIGVVSIINANAGDTPKSTVAVSQAGDQGDQGDQGNDQGNQNGNGQGNQSGDQGNQDGNRGGDTPPTVLPWGQRPKKLTTAPPGTNGRQVRRMGADIAPNDNSGDASPKPEWAPKGRSSRSGGLREETTSIQPPQPPTAGVLTDPVTVTSNPVNYFYAVGSQAGDSDGAFASVVIGKPYLAQGDYHTLAEISVQSADGQQIVEVGWNVDRTINGDDDPHLFVYHWVDRQGTCYNGCGWRQYSRTTQPGYTLPVGASRLFGIQHANGAWWVAYDTEWIGYFPDDLWNGRYTRSGLQQFFGEVATSTNTPCSQMGNGTGAYSDGAARFGSITQINGPAARVSTRQIGGFYDVSQLSDRTFRYGGPGGC